MAPAPSIFEEYFSLFLATLQGPIIKAVLTFLVCYIAIRILRGFADRLLSRSRLDGSLQGFLRSAVHVALWALAIIIVAESLGIETASLVAVLSVAGLALSLSMQGTLSNLFSGITLLAVRPFAAGDFVELGTESGKIQTVGLFYTTLATADNKRIFVPNSDISASRIVNYSHEPTRRVDLSFSADYGDSTEKVREALLAAVAEVPEVLSEPGPFIAIQSYGDNAIEYVLRVWSKSEDYWTVYYALNEGVRRSFEQHGVTMTYPHMNVHIVQ